MRPARKAVALIAGGVIGAGVGLFASEQFGWGASREAVPAAAVATGLCVTAAVVTLLFVERVTERAPQLGPVAVLLGTGMRMTVAVVGVVLLGELLRRYGTPLDRFARWVAYLYIVTLAIECGLLMIGRQSGATR